MSRQTVAITANRNINKDDEEKIFNKIKSLVEDKNVKQIVFGGARGGDNFSLLSSLHLRDEMNQEDPYLLVILPNTINHQPVEARPVIKCADEVLQLGLNITYEDDWKAYKTRNREMVRRSDRVVGFWDGKSKESGTYDCMKQAIELKRPVEVIKIEGLDK